MEEIKELAEGMGALVKNQLQFLINHKYLSFIYHLGKYILPVSSLDYTSVSYLRNLLKNFLCLYHCNGFRIICYHSPTLYPYDTLVTFGIQNVQEVLNWLPHILLPTHGFLNDQFKADFTKVFI